MNPESISLDGRIAPLSEVDGERLLSGHYIYQGVHTLDGRPLRLNEHLAVAARAFLHIHGFRPRFDAKTIAAEIAELLGENRYPATVSSIVTLRFFADGGDAVQRLIVCEKPLMERGYSVSSLRPSALSFDYDITCEGFPTNFSLSAARLHDSLAFRLGAARAVRRKGDILLSCGDSPLFGIRGRTLFTAPLSEGAADSVERRAVISAAASSGLDFLEEGVPVGELTSFDELFLADAAGITSLAECDGAKFMSLLVVRLAGRL